MRTNILKQLGRQGEQWDVLVIGGGASGLGAAVEAVSRGYRTLLVERFDFAKGTSSRSTKLAHGGVRYLEQLNLTLVLDALRERGRMLRNAPHLVHDLSFVVPAYSYFSLPYYGIGLKVYEQLSGSLSMGRSELLSRNSTLEKLPGLAADGLRGGILYHDGQFDDARFAIALLRTLEDLGGTAINYVEATGLLQVGGKTAGIRARDRESGAVIELQAKVVINACGVHAEETLAFDGHTRGSLLAISQGTHFVLPHYFLPGNAALMVPKTADGRVLFAIPWHGATLVGTTDEPVDRVSDEPRAKASERDFLLDHITRYLHRTPTAAEILSVWSGQRPLVRNEDVSETAAISREHTILVSKSKLVTILGGKWTTYRRMAEDVVNRAAPLAGLKDAPSKTADLHLHGWTETGVNGDSWRKVYGSDWSEIEELSAEFPEWAEPIHPRLPFIKAEVVWAARYEMARTVEDVLARRTRALFLDARACQESAPAVASLLAQVFGRDAEWITRQVAEFHKIVTGYIWNMPGTPTN